MANQGIHPLPQPSGSNRKQLKWVLTEEPAAPIEPLPPSIEPAVPMRRNIWGLSHQQDQRYADDVYGIAQEVDKAKRAAAAMAHITEFGNAVAEATAQKMEDDARAYDEDSVAGQLGKRLTLDGANDLAAFNKRLGQTVADNLLQRFQR